MTDVWMIGGTGLIGRSVARRMRAGRKERFRSLVRRETGRACEVLISFDALPELPEAIGACDTAISCLGSTIRKAGSWEAFARIDTDHVLTFAEAAKAAGARQFIHVSSVGADPKAGNRYLRMKGNTEAGLAEMGFDRLDIVRPGLLLGGRSEFRPAERAGTIIAPLLRPLMRGRLSKYRAIAAEDVAAAIASLVGKPETGRFTHLNRDIETLAKIA